MAADSVLTIGDKVVLSRIDKNGDEKTYNSRIVDFVSSSSLMIEMPMENAMYIPLKTGREFHAKFFTATNMYQCRVLIRERVKEGGKYFLNIKYLSELEKIQRREFFRLDCVSEIDVCVNIDDKENREWEKAVMIDISGGGIRFNCNLSMEVDQIIAVRFPISNKDEKEFMICPVKILYVTPISNSKIEYRVCFEDIESIDRERIIKHIFEEERRRRKNRS